MLASRGVVSFNVINIINNRFEDFGRLTYKELEATIKEEDHVVMDLHTIGAKLLDVAIVKTCSQTKEEADNTCQILKACQQKKSKFAKLK